jgi:hypothetical protein
MKPELYVTDTNEYPGLAAPNRITEPLLRFPPKPNRWARGSAAGMHRYLLPYYRAMRARGIRFQRVGDHRSESGPDGILRTRRYRVWLADEWHGGDLLVTTRWDGERLGIVEVQAPAEMWQDE